MSSWIGLEEEWQRNKKALEIKRKPREPDQCYWLDLPTREPLSFCQANSAAASLPHMPDPTSPSLFPSFRLFLFLRHGCSNLVLRLGTHWAVAMVTGKLFGPCASKETFPLPEFPPWLHRSQWGSFSVACPQRRASGGTVLARKGRAVLPAVHWKQACSGLGWRYLNASRRFQYAAPLFFPHPSHFWSKWHQSRRRNTTQQCHWWWGFSISVQDR